MTVPLLLRLGFWQLDRAEEKRAIQRQYSAQMAAVPTSVEELFRVLEAGDPQSLLFRRVQLNGRYLPEYTALLDNRIEQGRAGYHVYSALLVDDKYLVWINRGWVAGANDRSLPMISTPSESLDLLATVYISPGESLVLADDEWRSGWPVRVQRADIQRLNDRLRAHRSEQTLPLELRIEQAMPGGLYVDWQLVSTNPEKHTGYAVQWFAMALALVAFWIYQLWAADRKPE